MTPEQLREIQASFDEKAVALQERCKALAEHRGAMNALLEGLLEVFVPLFAQARNPEDTRALKAAFVRAFEQTYDGKKFHLVP